MNTGAPAPPLAQRAVQVDGVPVRQHLRLGGLQVGLHREAGLRQIEGVFPVGHGDPYILAPKREKAWPGARRAPGRAFPQRAGVAENRPGCRRRSLRGRYNGRRSGRLPGGRNMTRAVFFDVDFTLIYPGPSLQGEGYGLFCARHGVTVDTALLPDGRRAGGPGARRGEGAQLRRPAVHRLHAGHHRAHGRARPRRGPRGPGHLRRVGGLPSLLSLRRRGAGLAASGGSRAEDRADFEHAAAPRRVRGPLRPRPHLLGRHLVGATRVPEAAPGDLRGGTGGGRRSPRLPR